jgi:hypothetical protein
MSEERINTSAQWSGTEGRQRQAYIPLGKDRAVVCECVSLRCKGAMRAHLGNKLKCDDCGLIIARGTRR